MIDASVLVQTNRGCYHSFFFDLVDTGTGAPINLTGYALEANYRERAASPRLITTTGGAKLLTTIPTAGRIQLIIDEADTLVLPSRDITYTTWNSDPPFTCWCQIDGYVGGRRYQLVTVAIDNLASTAAGGT